MGITKCRFKLLSTIGGRVVVRAWIKGVFCTYKLVRGERRTYWYHRSTGTRLHGVADAGGGRGQIRFTVLAWSLRIATIAPLRSQGQGEDE